MLMSAGRTNCRTKALGDLSGTSKTKWPGQDSILKVTARDIKKEAVNKCARNSSFVCTNFNTVMACFCQYNNSMYCIFKARTTKEDVDDASGEGEQ